MLAGKCLKRWSNDAVLSGKSVPPQFFCPSGPPPSPPPLQIKLGGPIAVNCSGIIKLLIKLYAIAGSAWVCARVVERINLCPTSAPKEFDYNIIARDNISGSTSANYTLTGSDIPTDRLRDPPTIHPRPTDRPTDRADRPKNFKIFLGCFNSKA